MFNKKLFVLILVIVTLLMACQQSKKPAKDYIQESTEKMMSIDDICKVEDIIADSSLMDAKGDTAWRKVSDKMIRIKIRDKYYLRQQNSDGSITGFTYRYE